MTAIGMIGAGRWGGNWIRTLAGLPGTGPAPSPGLAAADGDSAETW